MLKTRLLSITLLLSIFSLHAQKENNISLRVAPGVLLLSDSENLGLLLNLEPKIKISKNTAIGLRFGVALNSQKFENGNRSRFRIDENNDNAVISFMPTYDYYFTETKTRPFVGLGIGYYLLSQIVVSNPAEDGNVNNQLGVLLRGGFEWGKKRIGLEYNFIPKANIEISSGQAIGTVDNSYLGLSIGFTIGGGKSSM